MRGSESTLRDEIRTFIAEELRKGAFRPSCDSWLTGFDPGFSQRLAGRNWIGMTWPMRWGGQERPQRERYTLLEEMLAAGAPVAAHWIGDRQTGPLLLRYGTDEQRSRFLPAIARGECSFAIGMSEPDSGSDLASIHTHARRVDGGWSVSGTKVWTSHAQRSRYMIALVRTAPDGEAKDRAFTQMIIDLTGKGIQVRPIALISGEEHFNEVALRDAVVPDDMVVGEVGDGWRQVTAELAYERSGPERFLSTFPLLNCLFREIGDAPDRHAARELGELAARLWSLRALSMNVADSIQRGEIPSTEAAMVKDLGTRFEGDIIETARLLVSPVGGGDDFQRLYHEAVLAAPGFTLRGGTSEILRGIVARGLKPQGPSGVAHWVDADVAQLLVETANAVFNRPNTDIPATLRESGLDSLTENDLAQAALVVRVSAYHATEVPFAEEVLLPDPADRSHPHVAPQRASDHADLPPAYVLVAEFDPLRDQVLAYAATLEAAGVPVTVRYFDDQIHAFFGMVNIMESADMAVAEVGAAIRAVLA